MKYGWFSQIAKAISGSVMYKSPSGGLVEVTHTSKSKRTKTFKDEVFVGVVTEPDVQEIKYALLTDLRASNEIIADIVTQLAQAMTNNANGIVNILTHITGMGKAVLNHEERLKALEDDKPEFPTAYEPSQN